MASISPLGHSVRIVDEKGFPTPEFFQLWQDQSDAAAEIPTLNTAAEVSAYLDKISNLAQSVLLRGTSEWGAIQAPGNSSKFLNGATPPAWSQVQDVDLSLQDETTQNATSGRHGFLKKLINDTTMFLRSDGVWAVPSGGGGGGGSFFGGSVGAVGGYNSSTYQTKGMFFTPSVNMSVRQLMAVIDPYDAGTDIYHGTIAALDGSNLITGTPSVTNSVTVATASPYIIYFDFASAVSLTAGTTYFVGVVREAVGRNQTICPVVEASGGFWAFGAPGVTSTTRYYYNTVDVTAGQAVSTSATYSGFCIWIAGHA